MHQLVPRLILENYAAKVMQGSYPAAGMFVDISGFSAMTDRFMQYGGHGAEVLAGVMRATFSPLIRVVAGQGGLVINQAGDSITALFPLTGETDSPVARALAAAWQIQEQAAARPSFETPYGSFTISIKIGLAKGDCQWGIIDSQSYERAVYYFRGDVVDGCAEAEHQAGPGEIILAGNIIRDPAAQGLFEIEPRGDFYRMLGIKGSLPQPIPLPQPVSPLELARRFYPESVLTSDTSGEFRQMVSMFISLPTVRAEAQLAIFMKTFFELQERYGGLLSRLSFGDKGSHLLIFWGAPAAFENDVERAVDFILELQAQTEMPINGGITYRLAHAGFIGSDLAEEYTGYGHGANLAARFMTGAARGEIWLDGPAALRAGNGFELEPLGEKPFKGFAQPQPVYLLLERKEQAEPFYAGRLVGRETELETLRQFVQPALAGKYAGALVIWGEPGMGKSRLAHDFLKRLAEAQPDSFQVFLGQCDEILRQSLNPFRYWLKRHFEQSVEQSEARNKRSFNRKLDELIANTQDARLAAELDRTRSCLGALVGLDWPDSLYQQLDAQDRYQNTMLSLTALLQAESRQRPVIFFLEDAHWLDDDSKAFLPRLLRMLAGDAAGNAAGNADASYPLAILTTARFEGAGLPLETFPYAEIRLEELDRTALGDLAAAHLGGQAGESLLALVAGRAEGNPFFVEQILRYLQEEGRLAQQNGAWEVGPGKGLADSLPGSVQAVLVARLDRLARDVREIVQTAAVLGREFEVRLLAEMLQNDRSLHEKVDQATQAAVWFALNEIRYIFRHALMRDAAYAMQIQARRQALHALAVEALERLYLPAGAPAEDPDDRNALAPHYSELAYHAEQAGLVEKAMHYLIKAGDAAQHAYQNNDAVDFYSRALALTGPQTENETLRHLYVERGQCLERTGHYEQALADYRTLSNIAQERGDRRMALASLMAQSVILSTETNVQDRERGMQVAQQALDLARELNDRTEEAYALTNLALAIQFLQQDPIKLLPYVEQAISIARELNERELLAQALLRSAGTLIFSQGQFDLGHARVAEAQHLLQELGKPYRAVEGLQVSALGYGLAGHYPQAIQQALEADQINIITGSAWGRAFCASALAFAYMEQGDYSRSIRHWVQCVQFGEESGYLMGQIFGRASLSLLYGHIGRTSEAIALCQQALQISQSKAGAFLAHSLASLAWMYVFQGNLSRAEETIASAWQAVQRRVTFPIEPNVVAVVDGYVALAARDWPRLQSSASRAAQIIETMRNRFLAPDARYLLGRALWEQGQAAEARQVMLQALADAEAMGCLRMSWPILFALAQMEPDKAQAQEWLRRAREIILVIAAQIDNPEWRESFLNQTAVRAVNSN